MPVKTMKSRIFSTKTKNCEEVAQSHVLATKFQLKVFADRNVVSETSEDEFENNGSQDTLKSHVTLNCQHKAS